MRVYSSLSDTDVGGGKCGGLHSDLSQLTRRKGDQRELQDSFMCERRRSFRKIFGGRHKRGKRMSGRLAS